jgi:PleD family two-component response regulator
MDVQSPGEITIDSSGTSLKAVKLPDDGEYPRTAHPETGSILEELSDEPKKVSPDPAGTSAEHMRVLVAEDDPVNSRIVQKRLEKLGHKVYLTINGEECASAYGDSPQDFDVILMDMQVSSEIQNNDICL